MPLILSYEKLLQHNGLTVSENQRLNFTYYLCTGHISASHPHLETLPVRFACIFLSIVFGLSIV